MKYVEIILSLKLWFLGALEKLRKVTIKSIISCYPSVRPSTWNSSAPTGQIFMEFCIREFFENLSRKFEFHSSLTRITGTLHEDQYTFLIISGSVMLRMRNVSDISCTKTQNTFYVQ